MGTEVDVVLPRRQGAAAWDVQALFAEWEGCLSRFDESSELSRMNARAGEIVAASPMLLCVLDAALRAARATDGVYDPTLGRQMAAIGYARPFGGPLHDASEPPAPPRPGGDWRDVTIDAERGLVRLPEGVALDFGGIAKGMAVDAAVQRLAGNGISSALVCAGGDLAVTGPPPDGEGWPIEISHHDGPVTVPLIAGALATSSVTRRRWMQHGRRRHHLVDPRTGEPAAGPVRSATVAAASCHEAEIAAKTALILGVEHGAAFLEAHGLAGLLVCDEASYPVGRWPQPAGVAS